MSDTWKPGDAEFRDPFELFDVGDPIDWISYVTVRGDGEVVNQKSVIPGWYGGWTSRGMLVLFLVSPDTKKIQKHQFSRQQALSMMLETRFKNLEVE